MIQQLPETKGLNIPAFSVMFGNVTNSYKFYFFLALLDSLRESGFQGEVSFNDLRIRMLTLSWYPYHIFHLSFGIQDQLIIKLDQIENITIKNHIPDKSAIEKTIIEKELGKDLLRYVPYRLIRPFFANQLRGVKDGVVNKKVEEYSNQLFEEEKPLYKISSNKESITIHKEWLTYLQQHYGIIKDWVLWNLLSYMQKQNPNVPNLSSKLLPPQKRTSLMDQRKFWEKIIIKNPIKCIFSNNEIDPNEFALDHYLPWSYVGHDRLWNLIPIAQNVNSAKSNNFPDKSYFEKFVDMQYLSIIKSKEINSDTIWKKQVSCYLTDLFIPNFEDLQKRSNLESALQKTVFPAIELGSSMGFTKDWKYISVNFANTGTENVFETNSIQPKNVLIGSHENISPTPFIDLYNQAFIEYLPFAGEVAAGIPMHELEKTYQFSEDAFKSGTKSEEFLGEIDIDWIKCPERFTKNRRFVVKVTGDSMEPLCSIGDYLICEYHRHVQSGRKVVIMANFADLPDIGECAVKRIKESEDSWIFMSDNKKYDDIKVPKDDINPEYPIYGTVIYNLTKEKEIR